MYMCVCVFIHEHIHIYANMYALERKMYTFTCILMSTSIIIYSPKYLYAYMIKGM